MDLGLPQIPVAMATWDDIDDHYTGIVRYVAGITDHDGLVTSASALLLDKDSSLRTLGVDVLSELERIKRIGLDELLALTSQALHDPSEDVRWSVAVALQHRWDPRIAGALLLLANDPDSDVRYQAIVGLPAALREDEVDSEVIEALYTAAADSDPDIREWAVFGLAIQTDIDTPRLRRLLTEALDDPATADDARAGLERRGLPAD